MGPPSVPKPGRFFNTMAAIKNIIFDLGGVLLDIDFQKTIDAFEKLGLQHFENMYSQFKADELFEKIETGKISEAAFFDAIRNRTTLPLSHDEITSAWNALVINFRLQSLHLLEKLAGQYKLYLLSNTNSIHIRYFEELLAMQTGKPLLDRYFTKVWYSNKIGMRKPSAAIFSYVLQEEQLQAAETLFIDDTITNIETAKRLGFETHLLLPHERIEELGIF